MSNPFVPPSPYLEILVHLFIISSRDHSTLLHVRSRQSLYHTRPLAESRAENAICILEHAVLETDDDELRALEPIFDQQTNILGV
jgi:hypothetical protein